MATRGADMAAVRRFGPAAVSAGIALAVLAPLLPRGFVLSYDMVFAARQSLLPDSLGLGSALPRSVPADAVIALTTAVLAGDVVQKLVLFAALFAGPLGAAHLVPTGSTGIRIVAALGYGWSAYVAERLLIGHWPYLVAYACLPWIAAAGLAVRRGEPRALGRLVLTCAPAALTPTGGILATLLAITTAGRHAAWRTVAVGVVLNAPWWVPAVLHPGGTVSAPEGVAAFAAREESWGTAVTSLLGLGGLWNAEAVPTSRAGPLVPLLTLGVVVVALFGLRPLAVRIGATPAKAMVLLGAFGVLLAAASSLPVGLAALQWLVEHVPGAGLVRDAQKWVAWWALPLAIGFALGVEAGARQLRTVAARRALLSAAALLPVLAMPDLAWGAWGRLAPVSYPDDWATVRAVLAEDEHPGDVLTLPMSTFRRFAWNDGRTQLDPAPRVLPRPTVIDDTLVVGGQPVAGEDRRAAAVRAALAGGAEPGELGGLGIGWVLVEHGTPGEVDARMLAVLTPVWRGEWLSLYRVPGPISEYLAGRPPALPVLAADFAALALVVAGLLWRTLPVGTVGALTSRARLRARGASRE